MKQPETMKKLTDKEIADKIIKELSEAGLTPDEMLEVIKLAKEKFKNMKNKKQ